MKTRGKILVFMLAATMAAASLAGYGSATSVYVKTLNAETKIALSSATAGAETHEITDRSDEGKVTVPTPENLEGYYISTMQGALEASIILGQYDKVLANAYSPRYYWLSKKYVTDIYDLPAYGSFSDVNVEELLASGIKVVISMFSLDEINDKMREVGLTVVEDGVLTGENLDQMDTNWEVDIVAELTGTEEIAKKYYKWRQDTFDIINERLDTLSDDEKVTVMPMRSDITQVFHSGYTCGKVVEWAGGINVAANAGEEGKIYADCDPEQLLAWNPDYIFQFNFGGEPTEETLASYTTWSSDPQYANITAMKNGDVYMIPAFVTSWTALLEQPLGVMWMSSIMYPELWADFDVKAYAADFYKEFIDYDVTDEDWEIAAWQFEGANPNGLSE